MKPPVVVVPGITATTLADYYPTGAETLWSPLHKDYERVALHPDDHRFERVEPAQVRAVEAFRIPYGELVKELRHDLSPAADRPRPVYLFPYDWRRPLSTTVEELAAFVEEVAARTALLRHYGKGRSPYSAADGRVDLVGHSMGGLVIAGYLAGRGRRHRARKVVTIGTPFGGSFEAVIKIITGTSGLDGGAPKSREREVARVTPSLYHLLPTRGLDLGPGPSNLPATLFEPDLWQRGVVESLAEHIRLAGLDPAPSRAGRLDQARALLTAMLTGARTFRDAVDGLRPRRLGIPDEDWLSIVGVGEETRIRLRVEDRGPKDGPWFDLTSLDRRNGYPMPRVDRAGVAEQIEETGDGTVPYAAARPSFLDAGRLVCVSPDDFGYWELRDRLLEWATNLHAMLPAMNRVIKLCGAFLDAEDGRKARAHPGIRGRRSPEALRRGLAWDPPFVDLREEVPDGLGGLA